MLSSHEMKFRIIQDYLLICNIIKYKFSIDILSTTGMLSQQGCISVSFDILMIVHNLLYSITIQCSEINPKLNSLKYNRYT